MKRTRARTPARGRGRPDPRPVVLAGIDAMVDAMTRTASIIGRACPVEGKTALVKAGAALPRQIAALQHAGGGLLAGTVSLNRATGVAARTVESLLPLMYDRPKVMPRVLAMTPIVHGAIVASTGQVPLVMASLTPAEIDALIEALYALARALEEAAMDASPEDAQRLRMLAQRIAMIIAALRSGATLAQIQMMVAALIEEIMALLARFPASIARIVGARLTDLIRLLTRLGGAGGGAAGILFKALLAAIVFLLAHLATRWVLENCTYEGVRLWDLLDENPIFDWWYGVSGGTLSNCDRLYRAFLSFRQQRRMAQSAGEDQSIISILAQAEARALALWIDQCVDSSQRASWQRELARIRGLF